MKVKAKWNIAYNGTLYRYGDIFEMEEKAFLGAFRNDVEKVMDEPEVIEKKKEEVVKPKRQRKPRKSYSNKKMSSK